MKYEFAALHEALNPKIVESMKAIKDKIKGHEKLKMYIDDYDPKGEPYAYVLSSGNKYSLHCHLKWEKVAKRAAEAIRDTEYQTEMENTVADKVAETILTQVISGDYSEYNPKVKRNGIVIEVVLSVPKIKNEPANMMAQEAPLTPPEV